MRFWLNGKIETGEITESMGYQHGMQMYAVEHDGKEYLVERIGRKYYALKNQTGIAGIYATGTACGQLPPHEF